jgi:hypothetical protein
MGIKDLLEVFLLLFYVYIPINGYNDNVNNLFDYVND